MLPGSGDLIETASCQKARGAVSATRQKPSWAGLATAATLAMVVVSAVACGGAASPSPDAPPVLLAAASTGIAADWVREVGGERVEVFSLVPAGRDPHTFQPGVRTVTRVADADIVFTIGLGLEAAWLNELMENSAADPSRIVVLGAVVDPLDVAETGGRSVPDPHFWLDPIRVGQAIDEIAARLSVLDPEGEVGYGENAAVYRYRLGVLHAEIVEQVASVPVEHRVLVTSHDSFRYFAARYRLRIVGAVIPGVTTEREASAAELARLTDAIRINRVPAVFSEAGVSDRLVNAVAAETGARVVDSLRVGTLGEPGSGVDTYIEMMRADVAAIAEALR